MNKRRLVIYRVSRKDSTTKNQEYFLDAYVRGLPEEPSTLKISDSNWRRPIPEMQEVLAQVKRKVWDEIVVFRTDRLGRRCEYDTELWYACQKNDCVLIILDEDLRSDRKEDETRFLRKTADARDEQLLISKRVKIATARIRDEVARGIGDWRWVGRKKGADGKKVRDKEASIVFALKGGASVRFVAQDTGFSEDTIRKIRDRHGIPSLRPDAVPPPAPRKRK